MHKIARAALGAAMMVSATVGVASAAPEDDMLSVVAQRAGIDRDLATLPGVFAAGPPSGVLGVQVRRDNLPEPIFLDMLRVVGHRVDIDDGLAAAAR